MFTLFDQEWVTQIHEKNLMMETAKTAKAEGMAEGKKEGMREGKRNSTLESLQNLMDSLRLEPEQAMSALKIPPSEQPEYRKLLETESGGQHTAYR